MAAALLRPSRKEVIAGAPAPLQGYACAVTSWTFEERVDRFLALHKEMSQLRLAEDGIDLSAKFHFEAGQPWRGELAPLDTDHFRSFIVAWRQFVMRDEPVHLRTVLDLCPRHLTRPELQALAVQLRERLELINTNQGSPIRFAFSVGGHEYTRWEVADLFMHGLIFHQRERAKADLLSSVDAGTRAMLELQFREYVAAISELVGLTSLVLHKAVERGWIGDAGSA